MSYDVLLTRTWPLLIPAPTLIDDLVASGQIDNWFGLCLDTRGTGSQMYLGSNGTEELELALETSSGSTVEWTPRIFNGSCPKADQGCSGLYNIEVIDVLVDGISLGLAPAIYNEGSAIVDSGTSDVCFPYTAFESIKVGIKVGFSKRVDRVCIAKSSFVYPSSSFFAHTVSFKFLTDSFRWPLQTHMSQRYL